MRIASIMAGILILSLNAACAGGEANQENVTMGDDDIREMARGNYSEVVAEQMVVIREPAVLDDIWRDAGEGEPPDVDFEREMVIAVFMGERRTGGHTIHVESVQGGDDGVTVSVRMEAPGRNCMTTQSLTQPYQIVRLPRIDGDVSFEIDQVEVDC